MKTTNRRLVRPSALLGAGLLSASLVLTACGGGDGGGGGGDEEAGGGDTSSYCDTLADAKSDIDALESGEPQALEAAFDAFDELESQAPDEVADEWATMQEGVQTIEDAFAEAGLEIADLEQVMAGEIPEGVDPQALAELGTTLQELDSTEFQEASDTISQHAQDECGINLDESGAPTE